MVYYLQTDCKPLALLFTCNCIHNTGKPGALLSTCSYNNQRRISVLCFSALFELLIAGFKLSFILFFRRRGKKVLEKSTRRERKSQAKER